MNDRERELWIMNDEGMYNAWKRSGLSITAYIRGNRKPLTQVIESKVTAEPVYPRIRGSR